MSTRSVFLSVLSELKQHAEKVPKSKVSKDKYFNQAYKKANNSSYNQFENLISWSLSKLRKHYKWDNKGIKYHLNFGHYYPDINIKIGHDTYGLELKSTKSNNWTISGGSVFETHSKLIYSDIYVFFGTTSKNTQYYKIRYKPYWQAIDSIKVTHSPRYQLDMNSNNTVYKTWKQYASNRRLSHTHRPKMDKRIHKILINQSTKVHWYNTQITPTSFRSFPKNKRNEIWSEVVIMYPQDILQSKIHKYNRASKYLLTAHFCYSSSFRDLFSAGGKEQINGVYFPKIIKIMKDRSFIIKKVLKLQTSSFKQHAYSSWLKLGLKLNKPNNFTSLFNDYRKVLDYIGNKNPKINKSLNKSNQPKLSSIIF